MGDKIGANNILVGRPEGMRPLGRTRRRWEDNIKIDPQNGDGESLTRLTWVRTGRGGRRL